MFPAVSDLFGTLDRRFVSTVWLPVQAFLGGLLLIALSGVGWTQARNTWAALPVTAQVSVSVGYLVAGTLLAYALAAQLPSLVRLYEGYWLNASALRGLGNRLTRRRRGHRTRLAEAGHHTRAAMLYPSEDKHLLPTRFGNIMRAAETHSWQRYRLDAVLFWPRLHSCLPDPMLAQIAAARSGMEFMLVVSILGYAFCVVGTVTAIVLQLWWGALGSFGGGLVIGWVGHRSSLSHCHAFSTVLRAAFDVHRFAILDTLGWKHPTSWKQEREQWQAIGHLWLHGAVGSAADAELLGYDADRSE